MFLSSSNNSVTTHNADCQECDLRINHVPARDWPIGSKRPVYNMRAAYPRYLETPELNIHGPDFLKSSSYPDESIYSHWNISKPIMFIDQVSHTYGYTIGAYGIQNEMQVSIGESTCQSVFVGKPIFDGGKAAMHMTTLTEIALERCDSARCAIQLMGDFATKYGFYGSDWNGSFEGAQDEAGEAITISDPHETWFVYVTLWFTLIFLNKSSC